AAQELASEIAQSGPLAVMSTRETLRRGLANAVEAATERELVEQEWQRRTADFKEGGKAMAERRLPDFTGRWRALRVSPRARPHRCDGSIGRALAARDVGRACPSGFAAIAVAHAPAVLYAADRHFDFRTHRLRPGLRGNERLCFRRDHDGRERR